MKNILFATALIILSVNYYINRDFYPALLKYQSESEIAYYVNENNISKDQLVFLENTAPVADVLLHQVNTVLTHETVKYYPLSNKYVFTGTEGLKIIESIGFRYELINIFNEFSVTRLTGKFINSATRDKTLKKNFLVKILPGDQ